LQPDLAGVACDGTAFVNAGECGATAFRGEEADANAAYERRDEMGVEDAEGVVDMLEEGNVTFAQVEGDLMGNRLAFAADPERNG
jgi:hypothetical protein